MVIETRQQFGTYLSTLRSTHSLSLEDAAQLVTSSRSSLSRLETGSMSLPLKGPQRKLVIDLGELLCQSRAETERYLQLAGIDSKFLAESEMMQLGLAPLIVGTSEDERDLLASRIAFFTNHLRHLDEVEQKFETMNAPACLKGKIQSNSNTLNDLQERLNILQDASEALVVKTKAFPHYATDPVYASVIEGKIVVGQHYHPDAAQLGRDLYSLASPHALMLMQLADVEHFAVDDCILLTNSPGFSGWDPQDIKTTITTSPLPVPMDVNELQQEKRARIEQNYFNSSHYRLGSYTPSFSDRDVLEITLAPIGFHEYFSITPFFDEKLLQSAGGSPISLREKYGNTALTYSATDRGASLIPTPVSIQCVVVTSDGSILLMRRSSSVAFYPGHWSASFEETMNAPGFDRKGNATTSDDANFFAGAIRGLEEEFAVHEGTIETMKVLSLNVEYLTLSVDVIIVISIRLSAQQVRQNWLLKASDRDEADKFALLSSDMESILEKLFSQTLWHPTARMRLVQFLFHKYGVDAVVAAMQSRLS